MLSSPVDQIKDRLDIVDIIRSYIKLQKAGVNYRAVCPFHSEKKPSFFVSPARQMWHCFGACSEGGDIFKFVMKIEGVDFKEALRMLAQRAGVELKKEDPKLKTERERLHEISELACSFFEKQLESSAGKEAKDYLLKRGIKEESIKKWRIGYSPNIWQGLLDFLLSQGYRREEAVKAGLALKGKAGNYYDRFRGRIIFPVFDLSSQVIGFGGRVFKQDDTAKYVNSPATLLYDKSRVLYGLDKAGMDIRKKNKCVLVEGYMDAIMVSQAGFENVVATSGTALTPYQLRILKRYTDNILTAFDMDIAGDSATKRGIDLAQTEGFNIKIITMPQGKDPADIALEGSWPVLVDKAKSIHDFYFDNVFSQHDKNSLEGKKNISKILLPIIKKVPNKIEQNVWIKNLASDLEVREEDVIEELTKIRTDNGVSAEQAGEKLAKKTRKELLEERLALLILQEPKNIEFVKEEDLDFFSNKEIVAYLCNNKGIVSNVPESLADKINYLCLKAEVEPTFALKEVDVQQEFKECLRQLKTLFIREKLDSLSKEIKKAEQENDLNRAQQLIEQFNQYSRSWTDLEVSEI